MVALVSLWLPILLSAIAVFFVSCVTHMVLKYHKTDYQTLPSEDALMDAMRKLNIVPGDYMLPGCSESPNPMKDPAIIEKMKKGPVVVMTVMPSGTFGMGKSLTQWFIFCLVVSVFAGYVASCALGPGQSYMEVFRFAGTTAFAGYVLAQWPDSIWYKRKWSTTIKCTFDGLLYALATAAVFGAMWPKV